MKKDELLERIKDEELRLELEELENQSMLEDFRYDDMGDLDFE